MIKLYCEGKQRASLFRHIAVFVRTVGSHLSIDSRYNEGYIVTLDLQGRAPISGSPSGVRGEERGQCVRIYVA